jgi:hypothetical protein
MPPVTGAPLMNLCHELLAVAVAVAVAKNAKRLDEEILPRDGQRRARPARPKFPAAPLRTKSSR